MMTHHKRLGEILATFQLGTFPTRADHGDGLAAGKGVLIIDNLEEAKKELGDMLGGMFGDASKTVVIEEFLDGIECSVFVLTDGNDYKVLPVAKNNLSTFGL